MALMAAANVSHVAYTLLLYGASFLLFLFVCMLLQLYATHAYPVASKRDPDVIEDGRGLDGSSGHVLGERLGNGHATRIASDAEEFELEGLMSDDDEGDPSRKKTNGIAR